MSFQARLSSFFVSCMKVAKCITNIHNIFEIWYKICLFCYLFICNCDITFISKAWCRWFNSNQPYHLCFHLIFAYWPRKSVKHAQFSCVWISCLFCKFPFFKQNSFKVIWISTQNITFGFSKQINITCLKQIEYGNSKIFRCTWTNINLSLFPVLSYKIQSIGYKKVF